MSLTLVTARKISQTGLEWKESWYDTSVLYVNKLYFDVSRLILTRQEVNVSRMEVKDVSVVAVTDRRCIVVTE